MSVFPSWISSRLLDDAAFVAAYDRVSDRERALLKTGIARLHAWLGEGRLLSTTRDVQWRQGFVTTERREVLDWALVLLDGTCRSPARLIATALPALLAGVESLLVARVDTAEDWPPALLTALELSGLESVADLGGEEAERLLTEMATSPDSGLVLTPSPALAGGLLAPGRLPAGLRAWWPETRGGLGVWLEKDGPTLDIEALNFAHAGESIDVRRMDGADEGAFEDFLTQGHGALVLPPDRVDEALDRCPVVLGPGCEACWFWPSLTLDLFLRRCAFWMNDE